MPLYSYTQKQESILHEKDINFYVPGGITTKEKDWYPFMLYFNSDEGFSRYTGKNLSLTILYSFGSFNHGEGFSTYYDPSAMYYSSFCGGYAVYNHDDPTSPFGFNNKDINIDELALIPKYDQTRLVLPSIGCPYNKITFETTIDDVQYDVNYIGIDGWTRIDSTIITNSPLHSSQNDYHGYIQYGKPTKKLRVDEEFPLITLKGRMYATHIEEHNMTFVLYVLAPSLEAVNKCDRDILSNANIK